jgi:hypothetical protein
MKTLAIRLILICIGLFIGAIQENWKIDINYILEWSPYIPNYESLEIQERAHALKSSHPYMPYDYYFNHRSNDWILHMDVRSLTKLKWGLTFLFVGVFLAINWLLVRTFNPPKKLQHLLWKGYAVVLVVSAIIFMTTRVFDFANQGYAFVRELVGGLQSMVPGVILCMGYLVYIRTKKTESDGTIE